MVAVADEGSERLTVRERKWGWKGHWTGEKGRLSPPPAKNECLYTREIFFSFLKNEKNIGNSIILSLNHPDVLFLYNFSYLQRLNLYQFVRMTSFVELPFMTIHPPEELLFSVQTEYGISSSRVYKGRIYGNQRRAVEAGGLPPSDVDKSF